MKTPGVSHSTGWDGHPEYPQHQLTKRKYHDTSTIKIKFSLLCFCMIYEQRKWDASVNFENAVVDVIVQIVVEKSM